MNIIVYTNFLLLVIISACAAAGLTDEQLAQIFNEKQARDDVLSNSRDEYASIQDINDLDQTLATLIGDSEDTSVSKRPFCNGFTGCGRLRGKRLAPSFILDRLSPSSDSSHETPSAVRAKRPFCNGFFGCGNPGKRLVFRNAPVGYDVADKESNEKRIFCNPGAFGCSNRNKRFPFSNSMILRMKSLMDSE